MTNPVSQDSGPSGQHAKVPTFLMAVAAGVAVASVYYNQPMLGLIAHDFPGAGADGFVPTLTQLGYALGLILLVPLGDILERRRLIVVQFVALALALALMGISNSAGLLIVASLALGACATAAQQVVPLAAHLAPPAKRGAVVGTVMAGLLGGILLSRTVAGAVASELNWRDMFWMASPVALVMGLIMAFSLPHTPSTVRIKYHTLLSSLLHLWREFPALRWAALTQAMLFGSFSAFWTILALRLEQPQFHLGPAAAGLFGIVGFVGIFAAPIAGRIADRRGPHMVVVLGAVVTLLSWIVFGLWTTIPGLVVGVILLDFGVQSALISNQHIVYALRPEARARINTVFMASMFLGGAAGAAIATIAWHWAAWWGVVAVGIVLAKLAVVFQGLALVSRRTEPGAPKAHGV